MDIVENRSYKTKVLWDFSPSTFIYAQGHVRKLAALLHVPRAASSGEGRSPTRLLNLQLLLFLFHAEGSS